MGNSKVAIPFLRVYAIYFIFFCIYYLKGFFLYLKNRNERTDLVDVKISFTWTNLYILQEKSDIFMVMTNN